MRMRQMGVAFLSLLMIMQSSVGSLFVKSNNSDLESIIVAPTQTSDMTQHQRATPLHIRDNSDFALYGATGIGTPSNPYRLVNLEFMSNLTCIIIENTTAHFSISNCILETRGQQDTILFSNVENGRVENCEIKRGVNGISITDSHNIVMESSLIHSSRFGIYLKGTSNSTIVCCNSFYNNRGVVLDESNHCKILNNKIYGNWYHGIELSSSCHNNSIYGNSIGWNGASSQYWYNAIDDGEDNFFDDNISIGNYWSDFNELEEYMISGDANSVDSFAQLLEDYTSPILVPLNDIEIKHESVGNKLTWLVYDEYPRFYRIRENQVNLIISVWLGGNISVSLDQLSVGVHTITITIYDGANNEASDEVLVTVLPFVLSDMGSKNVIIASGITIVSLVLSITLIKRLS